MKYHFRVGEIDAANELVKRFHYSRRTPANVQCVGTWHTDGGLFGDRGEAVAACFFSLPPTRWSEEVWELSRLVRNDAVREPLSGLIASTCQHIHRGKRIDLLVSFADRTQGHHGGIYQAASWRYAGCRERRMDGVIVNGQFVPGRSANSAWGTQSPERLAARGIIAEPHYDEGKHLYWRALSRLGRNKAARLGLFANNYPKNNAASLLDERAPMRVSQEHTLVAAPNTDGATA